MFNVAANHHADDAMQDGSTLFLDLSEFSEEVGGTFHANPQGVEPLTAYLSSSNLDCSDFADDAADPDGICRDSELSARDIRICRTQSADARFGR